MKTRRFQPFNPPYMKAREIRYLLNSSYSTLAIGLFIIAIFFACMKKADEVTTPKSPSDTIPVSQTPPVVTPPNDPPLRCASAPDYGDSVLCAQWLGEGIDYMVKPKNFPGKGLGTYVAFPEGLVIDQNTGAINVTSSESGLIFKVGWVAKGSKDTCFTKIFTSGITFMDGVHILSDNDTLAIPIYNGDPNNTPVCGSGGKFSKCQFDNPNDAGGSNYTCNSKNIKVDTLTGVIGLNKSLLAGLFGILPSNGSKKEATLYYRLDDCSNMSLRQIKVEISYYYRISDVPQSLLNDINTAKTDLLKLLFGREGSYNPRPPHIVIVASH
jgi:hypothetical protein